MANGTRGWGRLTRGDLAQFDDIATQVVLYAMERGGTGRLSRKGHAILRAPAGGTMSVPRDGNRSQQVLEMTVRKLFGNGDTETSTTTRLSADEAIRQIQQSMAPNPELECTVPGCEAVFVTEGARYSHLHDKHRVCPHPGCNFARDHAPAVAGHYRIVHQGLAPARGHGKHQKARAKHKGRKVGAVTPGSRQSSILAYLMSRPSEVVTIGDIRANVEGVDSTAVAHAISRAVPGSDWAKVKRVEGKRGEYVYVPDLVTTHAVPVETPEPSEGEHTQAAVEPTTVEPGVPARADDMDELLAWIRKDRAETLERVAQLETEIARLRTQVDQARSILRGLGE